MPGVDEFDFGDPGASEVDLPAPAIPDLPAPAVGHGAPARPVEHDLPTPVSGGPPAGLDLPTPISGAPPMGHGLPTPISGANDLPGPVQTDIDLPAPVDLDLPTPVQARAGDSGVDLPAPADLDLPVPADLDLPTPVDTNLPTPVDHNLPQPAAMDLEPTAMDMEPAAQELRPGGGQDLQPVEVDFLEPRDTELAPAEMGLTPAEQGLTPVGPGGVGAAAAAAAAAVGTASEVQAPSRAPSPAHKATGRTGPSRAVWIAAAGLIGVVGIGAALVFSGILDPTDPEPVARGAGKPGGGKGSATPGSATERSAEALAKLAMDTPQGYVDALALAEKAGDIVGKAEAALASAYRYGPNPQAVQAARGWLGEYDAQADPFVQRVVGLGALAAGDAAKAEAALAGDDARTRLYRGWLRLAQQRYADAADEAAKLLEANANDVAAQALAIEARASMQPEVALQLATKALEANPDHPGLLLAATKAGLAAGHFALAQTSIDKVVPGDDATPGYRARVTGLRGDAADARGDYVKALEEYDAALVIAPQDVAVALRRVDTLIASRRLNDANTAVMGIAKLAPTDPRVSLLAIEIALEGGEVDQARETLGAATKALPKSPDVSRLAGDLHAMNLDIEAAQTAYKQARELDATQWKAAAGEARLLARLKKLDEAIALLDAEATKATEGSRPGDAATLLTVKAELQSAANRNDAAITTLTTALDTAPSHNLAQLRRGVLRTASGDAAGGSEDLMAVFERTGGFPELQGPLGRLLLAQGEYDQLAKLIGGQLQGADTADSLLLLGARLRLHQSKIGEAKELTTMALTRMPGDWEAHLLMSQIYIAEGDPPKALAEVKLARPGIPQAEVYLQKGRVLEYNQLWDEAPKEYRQALKIDPELHEARYLHGRLLSSAGRYTAAEAELERVVEAEGAKARPWYPEAWLELGRAYERQGQNAKAIEALKTAQKLNEKLGEAFAIEGEIHARKNSHAPAIAALSKAVALAGRDDLWYPTALANLGRSQSRSGRNGAAKATMKKFLEVAPADHASRAEAQRIADG